MPKPDDARAYLTWPRLLRHATIAVTAPLIAAAVVVNVVFRNETLLAATLVILVPLLLLLRWLAEKALDALMPELVKANLLDHDYDHWNRPGSGHVMNYRDLFRLWALARRRKGMD